MNNNYVRTLPVLVLLTIVGGGIAQAETPLQGAWLVTSFTDGDGNTNDSPQPGLYIFTTTHYSIMIARGSEPRAQFEGDEMTDAEKVVAYDSFVANAGRYEVEGNKFMTRAGVAKNPNYMASRWDNERTFEFERDGDTLTIKSTGPGRGTTTLRRVEGGPKPW